MTPVNVMAQRYASARQRVVVLTFATVDDAERFDADADRYELRVVRTDEERP